MSRALPLILAACLLVPGAVAQSSDLAGGVFIAHYAEALEYSATPPAEGWCERYAEDHAITSCEEQLNRIDTTDGVVWFILAAWGSEKEWCGTEFGFQGFGDSSFVFTQFGPCCPSAPLEIPTSGWPGPLEGTAVVATSEPWSGDFVPVYYFAGYAYQEDRIDIGVNPATNGLGTANCANPPESWVPAAVGAMGLFSPGVYACPGEFPHGLQVMGADPPLQYAGVCCYEEHCYPFSLMECMQLGGVFHPEWTTCDPNPCSDQVDAKFLVIGPGTWNGENWLPDLENLAAAHEGEGIEGEVLTLAEIQNQYGATDTVAIRQAIRDRFLDFGGPPTRFGVLLAGDWASVECPLKRIIPPFYRYDPLLAWFGDTYETDLPYADLNGDDRPEILLGRLPVDNDTGLYHYYWRVHDYPDREPTAPWHTNIRLFCEDNDASTQSTHARGELARELTELLSSLCAPPFNAAAWYATAYPDPDDRWDLFHDAIGAGAEVLVAAPSTDSSSRDFLSFMVGAEHSIYDLPDSSRFPLVLGLSCHLGKFTLAHAAGLRPIMEHFMFGDWDAGSIAWIAPTTSAFLHPSGRFGAHLLQLLNTQNLFVGEIYVLAYNGWIGENPEDLRYAPGYCLFGDPFARLHGSRLLSSAAVDETANQRGHSGRRLRLALSPNPIRGDRRLTVALHLPFRDLVSMKLYDAGGRLVLPLSEGILEAGSHRVELGLREALTGIRGSGVYFLRAEGRLTSPAGGQVLIVR